ncbi:ABC transporter permease, partial [Bacillus subtilis]|nr:ABC transporter permease [Bacillus subtilis]
GLVVVSDTVLTTPFNIFLTLNELILSGELFGHLQISINRAAVGVLLGAGGGVMIGGLGGFYKPTAQYLGTSVQKRRT